MKKQIDFMVPIKELADQYPDFVPTMVELGFTKIQIPGMLATVGKLVNLKTGCQAMGIDHQAVSQAFQARGYEVINND